jgi:tetratricopeptide (TPR) repeat protein
LNPWARLVTAVIIEIVRGEIVFLLRLAGLICILIAALYPQSGTLERAREHYQNTRYEQAIELLKNAKDADSLQLLGQSWFQLGEFKKAAEALEKAAEARPGRSDIHLWLGRAYGRRAETSSFLFASRYASRARQNFEKAVELNPKNLLALNDLFEYYLQAPGFLGGGKDKAAATAETIAKLDSTEGYFAQARLADDRRDFGKAEDLLRKAIESAPKDVGRILDLARFLARRGRHQESEAEFQRAEKLAPQSPKILFERAAAYIEAKRNVAEARSLLQRYLALPLTPDDPPRHEAEKLLREAGS